MSGDDVEQRIAVDIGQAALDAVVIEGQALIVEP